METLLKPETVAFIRERVVYHEELAQRWTTILETLCSIDETTARLSERDIFGTLAMEGAHVTPQKSIAASPDSLLSTRQAAAYIGLAVQTLAAMRISGESPPFHKLGSRVFYKRDDLDTWVRRRRRRSTSDPAQA